MKILLTWRPPVDIDRIAACAEGISVSVATDRQEILRALPEADIVFADEFDAEKLAAAARLRWLHLAVGGVERSLFPEIVQSPVVITCLKTSFGIPGAEYALGAMLALTRRIVYDVRQRERDRQGFQYEDGTELFGKTMGVIGIGTMGQEIARRARCFGMRVTGLARSPRACPDYLDHLYMPGQMMELISDADFVVVAVPNTPDTRGMIGEAALRAMKTSAYLIDVSGRPAIYDLDALYHTLKANRIAGAALQANLPPESPLWELDNLLISYHRATSQELFDRIIDQFCENIRRFREGQPLLGVVDKVAGY